MINEAAITHDYTERYWGHDYTIYRVHDGGKKLDMGGWGRGLAEGDYLILPNGAETTRYRLDSIEYYPDPPDMWKAVASFEPRTIEPEVKP